MNPIDGSIHDNVEPEKAKERGLVPIPRREEKAVRAMSPEERIAWAATRKKVKAEKKSKRKARRKAIKRRGRR